MSTRKSTKKAGAKKTTAKAAGKGRAPAVLWSREKAENARKGGTYIKLGDKRGSLSLSGGKAMFAKDGTWIYVPSLRVAGRRQDVERVLNELVEAGSMQSGDVKDALAGAYRAGDENSTAFLAELDELKALRARGKTGATKAKTAEMKHSIAYYSEQIESATVESKAGTERKSRSPKKGVKKTAAKKGKSRSKSASPKAKKAGAKKGTKKAGTKSKSRSKSASPKKRGSPKGKRGAKPLAEKLEALAEGKVMDVSNLRADGSGAKVVVQPGAKSKKVLVPGFRLVSDKKNGIKAAAKLLGDESVVQRWMDAKAGGEGGASPSRSRSHSRSSSRSPSPARTHEMSPRPLSPSASLPPLPRASSPRSSGSGVSLPRIPTTLGSPRS
jgi:hypothetical protein